MVITTFLPLNEIVNMCRLALQILSILISNHYNYQLSQTLKVELPALCCYSSLYEHLIVSKEMGKERTEL